MIQRIQTVYLLLITGLLIAAMCLPMGRFVAADGVTTYVFKPLGVKMADAAAYAQITSESVAGTELKSSITMVSQSTWGLFAILFLSTVVALGSIFLFRNRMLQIRMTIFNGILLIGYYVAFVVFVFMLQKQLGTATFQIDWALCLPAIAIVLSYLSFRAIYRDELMVKAADRLR